MPRVVPAFALWRIVERRRCSIGVWLLTAQEACPCPPSVVGRLLGWAARAWPTGARTCDTGLTPSSWHFCR